MLSPIFAKGMIALADNAPHSQDVFKPISMASLYLICMPKYFETSLIFFMNARKRNTVGRVLIKDRKH
jgi:hypothetical protein